MNNQSLVSVIIIFLDAERFLQEAIESVLSQTYPHWELLLVDDGSSDGSTQLASRYAKQEAERIHYLEHEAHQNRGMSASRNLGIQHAKGGYIAFLDADDAWFRYTLEEQVTILEAQGEAAMVYGPLLWWYSWSGLPQDQGRDYIEKLGVASNSLIRPPELLPLLLLDKAAVPSGILVRSEAIERVGKFEEEFRGEYEDQVFCAKICLSEPIFASDRCWYRYRQHPASSVSIGLRTGQTHSYRLTYLNWLAQYLQHQGVKDPRVWGALRHELWPHRHPNLFRLAQHWHYWLARLQAWPSTAHL